MELQKLPATLFSDEGEHYVMEIKGGEDQLLLL